MGELKVPVNIKSKALIFVGEPSDQRMARITSYQSKRKCVFISSFNDSWLYKCLNKIKSFKKGRIMRMGNKKVMK